MLFADRSGSYPRARYADLTPARLRSNESPRMPAARSSLLLRRLDVVPPLFGRLLDLALRRRWLVLSVIAVLSGLSRLKAAGMSWHYLVTGVHVLLSPHAASLYARHPELQMGPLTFILGALFVVVLPGLLGKVAGMLFMLAVGVVITQQVGTLMHLPDRRAERRWFIASALGLIAWSEVAVHWGHLDDAMALLAAVVGVRLARNGTWVWAALAFAVAVDFKPWILPAVGLLMAAPRRQALLGVVVFGAVIAAAWAPFVLLDPSTVGASGFRIAVSPASTLHLLHLASGGTPPWCRAAQLAGGLVLAAIAAKRGRWAAVLMIVIALRLLLDPGTKNYYDSGLLVATGVFDVAAVTALPWATLAAALFVYLPSYALVGLPEERAVLRTVLLFGLLVVGFLRTTPSSMSPTGSRPHAIAIPAWARPRIRARIGARAARYPERAPAHVVAD